jgi:hypothetical protein
LQGRNEVTDELAKLSSSRAVVPTRDFMLELHESSINKALSKANKVAESSLETMSPAKGLSELSDIVAIHSD